MSSTLKKVGIGVAVAMALVVVSVWVVISSVTLPGEVELAHGVKRNVAQYIEMRDGVRLAVDVWLPEDYRDGDRLPTAMRSTRYWRAQDLGLLTRAQIRFTSITPEDMMDRSVQAFNEAGYAVVLVDVRGSGASFGSRPTEFGREEAADLGEVAGWISEQPWSNGNVGTWGVSYEGNTAAMAAAPAHPAIKAIAPQYADFDAWSQLLYPGGVFVRGFISDWGDAVRLLDAADICALAGVTGFNCTLVKLGTQGVKRVDGSDAEQLYGEALLEHETADVAAGAELAQYRDAPFYETGETIAGLSIHGYRAGIERSGAAIFSWAGWMDGGTVNGALALYSTFSNPVRLVIGPWSHGGGFHTDPFLADDAPTDPPGAGQHAMLVEFFDHYLKNGSTEPADGVGEISYFTFNDGCKTTDSWPPDGFASTQWYLGDAGTLVRERPTSRGASDEYAGDFTHTTGAQTRWHTQLGGGDVVYENRAEQGSKLLTYTTEPLEADVEVTGTVEIDLHVASTHADGAFFAYLEIVDPDGTVRYITEGQLRVIHRKPCEAAPPYPMWGPCHSFEEGDALPLVPGEPALIRFGLFNTSVLVPAGHSIRISLAGHDGSVFDRYPTEGDPTWTVYRDRTRASGITIPMSVR